MDTRNTTRAERATDAIGRTRRGAHSQTRSQRAVLGHAGILGTGRNAVGYAYCTRQDHVHIAPARAYTREPMTYGRERAIVRFAPRTSVGTGTVRTSHYDAWDGTRRILPSAPYVGGEAWRAAQRERTRNAPQGNAHTCEREHIERTPKCTCAAFGGVAHTHRTDDGIGYSQAPRITYAEVLRNIDARERLNV